MVSSSPQCLWGVGSGSTKHAEYGVTTPRVRVVVFGGDGGGGGPWLLSRTGSLKCVLQSMHGHGIHRHFTVALL